MDTTRNFSGKWITSADFSKLEPINVFHRQLDKKKIPSLFHLTLSYAALFLTDWEIF